MRHAERLVKHIRLRPRLPSECRSDDVRQSPRRDTLPHPVRRVIPPFAVRRSDIQLLRTKNIHGLFNYSYFT